MDPALVSGGQSYRFDDGPWVYRHGKKAVAHALGFSPQYINDVVRGKRKLSEKMLKALGLRAVTTYLPEVNP